MIDKAREIALKTLYKIDEEKAYSNIALDEEITNIRKDLKEKDVGLISQIVYGVTTWKITIDEIIQKHSKIKLKKISPWILNIIRMGIYQIIFLDKIPKSAAVDESVNLAKRYGHKGSSGFTNAILRKITRNDYEELFKIDNKIERISKTQSMPKWIIEELLKNNTIEQTEEICKNLNLKPQLSIRVNKLKINKTDLIKKLEEKNINCKNGNLEDFLILQNAKNIEQLEEFKQGYFTVQDESAGLTAILLEPKEGENVLDACSAPGGKTTYIAEIMNNIGNIDAWDVYEHRIKLIEENCKRLGITIVNTKIHDASGKAQNDNLNTSIEKINKDINASIEKINKDDYKSQFLEKKDNKVLQYDKILLDVPCLGIGVIKRKPDIKWQRNPEDIENITKLQYEILQNCSKFLKHGGELIYSTCSILKEENQDIIEKFIKQNEQFEIVTKECLVADRFKRYLKQDKFLEIVPSKEHDGFFICKIRRK